MKQRKEIKKIKNDTEITCFTYTRSRANYSFFSSRGINVQWKKYINFKTPMNNLYSFPFTFLHGSSLYTKFTPEYFCHGKLKILQISTQCRSIFTLKIPEGKHEIGEWQILWPSYYIALVSYFSQLYAFAATIVRWTWCSYINYLNFTTGMNKLEKY